MESITVHSAQLVGVEARVVSIKIDRIPGLGFEVVGLSENAAKESRVRVRAALVERFSSRGTWGGYRVAFETPVARGAAGFDLAIAMGILSLEAGEGPLSTALAGAVVLGELSLSGHVRDVRGLVPMLEAAERNSALLAIVPASQGQEARWAPPNLPIAFMSVLSDAFETPMTAAQLWRDEAQPALGTELDLADIAGLEAGKLALETAVATGKNLLLLGPPGASKTMLARRATSIMPEPSRVDRRELARIASAAGLPVTGSRPFRAPHHTASEVAIIGGGTPVRPGELTLAHGGVLLLDEVHELRLSVIEQIRSVVQKGTSTVWSCGIQAHTMPAKPLIIGTMNLCPCGNRGGPRPCTCKPEHVQRHFDRLRAPLSAIFELAVVLEPMRLGDVARAPVEETSAKVRERIASLPSHHTADGAFHPALAFETVYGLARPA